MADATAASDEELMDRYCAGDTLAFSELFRRFAPRLLRFARTFVGVTHAQDVVQQTFLKVHENRHRYRAGAKVSSWLFTIARNTALDHVRAAPQRREVRVDVTADAEANANANDRQTAPAQAGAATSARDLFEVDRVRRALHELPVDLRDVVVLHWFGDLGFDEIAVIVKASSVAVRSRAHRGYEKLRAILGDGQGAVERT